MSPSWEIRQGDALEVLRTLDAESVDAVVTDPPYGLRFMGKSWDHGIPGVGYWSEVLRVAKPGAHLLAFGGTRTFHRLACAIEDAGWEVRDCLMWLYGQGFPKSLDVSKAIDKEAGEERVVGSKPDRWTGRGSSFNFATDRLQSQCKVTEPATEAARKWQGWGTALKPAWEPIILARKPPCGTVAENVQAYGTGALNIDASRVGAGLGGTREGEATATARYAARGSTNFALAPGPRGGSSLGRWPANVVLDEEAAEALDGQSGELSSGRLQTHHVRSGDSRVGTFRMRERTGEPCDWGGDSGGASRFFYTAKAGRDERERGPNGELHPTVKPLSLMRWLVRLVAPPGALVLDPFCGSGSTGVACMYELTRFTGIDVSPEYVAMAERRITEATRQGSLLEAR